MALPPSLVKAWATHRFPTLPLVSGSTSVEVPPTSLCRAPVTTSAPFKGKHRAMPTAKVRASTILGEFERAQAELVGKAVILTDGKAGTVEGVWLDEMHGLRIAIRGHDGKWPISTIKLAERG
jgi:hypothetical protein